MAGLHVIMKLAAASACLMLLSACAMFGKQAANCTCPPSAAVATVAPPAAAGSATTPSSPATKVASAAPMTPQPKPAPTAGTAAAAPAPAPELSGAPGRIYFYRAAILGTVLQPDVLLNGEAVGKAVPQEYSYVERPPGTYQLTTTLKDTRSLTFTLPPGGSAYVEVNVIPGIIGGKVIPLLVDESEGKEALKHRHLSVH
jgi:hypothetical protein